MALNKEVARRRRLARTRFVIRRLAYVRLCVYRSNKHMYAQVISACGGKVLASASTTEAEIKIAVADLKGIDSAALVGKEVAQRAVAMGITTVAFDRSGYKYHGCVKALAEAAREYGLQF